MSSRGETHGYGASKTLSALEGLNGSTPSGSVRLMGAKLSVGGGHQNRALAHGYSISTPSGLAWRANDSMTARQ
jgi:hypothetical protein